MHFPGDVAAFNHMANRFLPENPNQTKKASLSLAVSTLHDYYYNPCNKNRKSV